MLSPSSGSKTCGASDKQEASRLSRVWEAWLHRGLSRSPELRNRHKEKSKGTWFQKEPYLQNGEMKQVRRKEAMVTHGLMQMVASCDTRNV